MNAFFIFLVIVLSACIAVCFGELITKAFERRQNAKALLLRDIKVKDALITELTLANRMLQVQLNLAHLVVERKTRRGLYMVEDDRPALLRPQI
jgi:hypothetical protein